MIHFPGEGNAKQGLNVYWIRGPVLRLVVGNAFWYFRLRLSMPKNSIDKKRFIFNHRVVEK